MAFTTETLPSEFLFTVTSGSESVFPLPTLQSTPSTFTGSDVGLGVEKNGSTLSLTSGYTLGPSGYLTTVTPLVSGDTLRVFRTTSSSAPLVTATLSTFTASMFNKGFWQLLFLIQELLSAIAKTLSYVVDSSGNLVWDFENKRGVSLASPIGDHDAANKEYVDTGDTAVLANATAQVATEMAARIAGDAATLASAQAYTRAWFPSITYVSGTDIPLIPSSQVCPAGTTRVYFPVAVYEIILTINSGFQGPSDYSFVPGNNYVDLTDALLVDSVVNAYIVGSSTISVFTSEVVSASAGDTVITMPSAWDGGFVIINSGLQTIGADYTHTFGTNTLTLTTALLVDSTVQVIAY